MQVITLDDDGKNGTIINKIKSGTWIERYLANGEFTFVGTDSEYLLAYLPVGKLVSHADTNELMMVETHEINDSIDDGTEVTIKGRSLDKILLENRALNNYKIPHLGYNMSFWSNYTNVTSITYGNAARALMSRHLIYTPNQGVENVPNLTVVNAVTGETEKSRIHRFEPFEKVYDVVLGLLAKKKYGLKVERPNGAYSTIRVIIHKGTNLSGSVQFSWFQGDIKKARYLFSIQDYKNIIYIHHGNATHRVNNGDVDEIGIHARSTSVDGSGLDIFKELYPTAPEITEALDAFQDLGETVLSAEKKVNLLDAEITPNSRWLYKIHYNLGDIVNLIGKYDTTTNMRVTEYAVTFDETETLGYPTLSEI